MCFTNLYECNLYILHYTCPEVLVSSVLAHVYDDVIHNEHSNDICYSTSAPTMPCFPVICSFPESRSYSSSNLGCLATKDGPEHVILLTVDLVAWHLSYKVSRQQQTVMYSVIVIIFKSHFFTIIRSPEQLMKYHNYHNNT